MSNSFNQTNHAKKGRLRCCPEVWSKRCKSVTGWSITEKTKKYIKKITHRFERRSGRPNMNEVYI